MLQGSETDKVGTEHTSIRDDIVVELLREKIQDRRNAGNAQQSGFV